MNTASKHQSVSTLFVHALFAVVLWLGTGSALAQSSFVTFQKTPDGATIAAGTPATFTYTITNAPGETSDAVLPQLTDPLPAGGGIVWSTSDPDCFIDGAPPTQVLHCDFPNIPPGATVTASVTGVPNTCAQLSSVATLTISNNFPSPVLTDPGSITVTCGNTGGRPMFVIGDLAQHISGSKVNFWGAQWWKNNAVSKGADNGTASFKGFATDSSMSCGGTWKSRPGNSSNPPKTIGTEIMVIVTDTVQKDGPVLSGTIKKILIVQQDGTYGPAPGHRGNGTVTGVICQ